MIINQKSKTLKHYEILNTTELISKSDIQLDYRNSSIKYLRLLNTERNNSLLAVFYDDYIQIWDMRSLSVRCGFSATITSSRAIEILFNRILIIGTINESDRKYYIEMWHMETCRLIQKRLNHFMIAALKLISNKMLASSHYSSNKIMIWTLFDFESSLFASKEIQASTVLNVFLESNRKFLITANLNGTVSVFNTLNWQLISHLESDRQRFVIYMKILSDEKLLLVESTGQIGVWDYGKSINNANVSSFKNLTTLKRKVMQVTQIDENLFLIGTENGLIKIWNVRTNLFENEFHTNTTIYSLAIPKTYKATNNSLLSIVLDRIMKIDKDKESKLLLFDFVLLVNAEETNRIYTKK